MEIHSKSKCQSPNDKQSPNVKVQGDWRQLETDRDTVESVEFIGFVEFVGFQGRYGGDALGILETHRDW